MKLRNQSGGILIAFIFCLGIAVMTIGFYYSNQFFIRKINYSKLLYLKGFEAIHDSVINVLFSPLAYVKTATDPANGDLERCLRDSTYLCPTGTRPLSLYLDDSAPGSPWLSMLANQGLSPDLSSCNTFPSIECPFRYDLKWVAECELNQASCSLPIVNVTGTLEIHPDLPLKNFFNTSRVQLLMRIR